MKKLLNFLYDYQSYIYKAFLYIISCLLILYLFPKGGKFKYEFQKGKAWQNETLFAPFDFSILKSEEEINKEKEEVLKQTQEYLVFDEVTFSTISNNYVDNFDSFFPSFDEKLFDYGKLLIEEFYKYGVLPLSYNHIGNNNIFLIREKNFIEVPIDSLYKPNDINSFLDKNITNTPFDKFKLNYYNLFFEIITPNVSIDEIKTEEVRQEALNSISYKKGLIPKGERIVAENEVVEGIIYQKLLSLQNEYKSELWNNKNLFWIVLGYGILVGITLFMFLVFIQKYRPDVFEDNKQIAFILFNIIAMIALTTVILKINATYVYTVPLAILIIVLKVFFDARLAFFTHIITLLLIGFIVPNSFEYIFLQVIVGIVGITTLPNLYSRTSVFLSAGQITLTYILSYLSFVMIHDGIIRKESLSTIVLFAVNGLGILFVQLLIYFYEKVFRLVSDISLLELSDHTNSKLLKELANKAPGTFNHSLQVANLAEAVANEIGADALLVRVAAYYHDIGKMNNAQYFSENILSKVSPHDIISPEESAKIIINHVINGIKIAKRNNLPEQIIDFIRTHHGTSKVSYFYQKEIRNRGNEENIAVEKFTYPGPKPFSKETAILMMADSIEAAVKSLKDPTNEDIQKFIHRIIDTQLKDGQLSNANITLAEIEIAKKVLIKKITTLYNIRVAYPE